MNDRELLARIIEEAYPEGVNGWLLADLILEAGFYRLAPKHYPLAGECTQPDCTELHYARQLPGDL